MSMLIYRKTLTEVVRNTVSMVGPKQDFNCSWWLNCVSLSKIIQPNHSYIETALSGFFAGVGERVEISQFKLSSSYR